MATLYATTSCSLYSTYNQKRLNFYVPSKKRLNLYVPNRKRLNFYVKAEKKDEGSSSNVAIASEENDSLKNNGHIQEGENGSQHESHESESERIEREKQQEMDWKTDEEFKKFMGNPSIEAAIKLEKKRADRKLKELDTETSSNPLVEFFKNLVRDSLSREKQRLEKAEEAFIALDLNKLRNCFGFDTFFATDVRRFGDGGIFIGNLRRPINEVIPKLEKKLSDAAGREVVLWFMEEEKDDIVKQACVVQPKSEMDLQFESTKLSTPWGYISAITLAVTTFGTIALTSGFFLKPDATIDDYLANVVPLFGGFLTILGVSEVTTRVTAARYGVKLSPSFLVPSNWTGCLGVMNNYESLLPNKKALFDIPVARTASAYLTSLLLAVAAFVADGSFNGGDNALYIRPQFFYNNPLFSFIQYVVGPYTDDLGNVLPYAVEGVGVPVDPLAFAGLLGMVVTSLNLLPCGRLEGGRIAQAMFGRSTATLLSFATSLLLGIGGLSGSVLCLAWGLFATFFRGGDEIPAQDEITPLGNERRSRLCDTVSLCNGEKICTLFQNGQLGIIQLIPQITTSLSPISVPTDTSAKYRKRQLVSWEDQLYLVQRKMGSPSVLEVWKADFETQQFDRIFNLDGFDIFLIRQYSVAVSSSKLEEKNCVYFTEDEDDCTLYAFHIGDQILSTTKQFRVLVPHNSVPLLDRMPRTAKSKANRTGDDEVKKRPSYNLSYGNTLEPAADTNICHHLTLDLQRKISGYLISQDAHSYMNFRLVCKLWRSVAPPLRWKVVDQATRSCDQDSMWLLSLNQKDGLCTFYNPFRNLTSYMRNNNLAGCEIRYSKDGWLLVSRGKSLYLLDLSSKQIIHLPQRDDDYFCDTMSFSA